MDLDLLEVEDSARWRAWLRKNHLSSQGVWLVFKKGGLKSISYDEALDESLAYGWIDSVIRRIDDTRYARKFTPRRPGSIWSSRNIARVRQLESSDRMTRWGLEAFHRRGAEISTLERVNRDRLGVPSDLLEAIRSDPRARARFEHFAPSHKKRYVIWVESAKKAETRKKRIAEAVKLIAGNVKDLVK